MKTIFITGASGFIGFNIAKKLLQNNYTIIAPVRKESVYKLDELNEFSALKIIQGNFYDSAVLNAINEKIDLILHFASIRGAGVAETSVYKKVNVKGTENLLNFARSNSISKFIFCSSVGVLGSIPKKMPASINDAPNPDGDYHQSKYDAEKLVMAAQSDSLKTCALRPPVTYGYKDDGFIPRMVSMIQSKTLILPSKDIALHMLSVKAFADLVLLMLTKNDWYGKVYNVADSKPVYLRELVNGLSMRLNNKPYREIIKVPNFIYNFSTFLLQLLNIPKLKTSIELISKTRFYDISETVEELGFEPADTLTAIKQLQLK